MRARRWLTGSPYVLEVACGWRVTAANEEADEDEEADEETEDETDEEDTDRVEPGVRLCGDALRPVCARPFPPA